jgi:hypothetical protein
VGVELGLGLAEGGVRGALMQVLLAVAAGETLHDVDGLEVKVATVRIGGVVGEADALDEVGVAEGLPVPPALQTRQAGLGVGHENLPSISDGGFRISDFIRGP